MEALLEVRELEVAIPVRSAVLRRRVGTVHALRGISFSLARGETLALVGESGSGKSTAARAIARLTPATAGRIRFAGRDILTLAGAELRRLRRELQIVFQDPYSSLNRRMRVGDALLEPLRVHGIGDARMRRARVAELLEQVGLGPEAATRYPVAFSGGQRQRIAIARALATGPRLVICDEPISSLDVPIQAQILNLLQELQGRHALSYLFITHDLGVARRFAGRIAVMHAGRIVELAPARALFAAPLHPYTRALLSAVPRLDTEPPPRIRLAPPPSPLAAPSGCLFAARCAHAVARCRAEDPPLVPVSGGRLVACHLSAGGRAPWAPDTGPSGATP